MREDLKIPQKPISYTESGLAIVSEKVVEDHGGFEVVERYVLGSHPELPDSRIVKYNTWSGGVETRYRFERIKPLGYFSVTANGKKDFVYEKELEIAK